MAAETQYKTVELDNNLILEVCDASRKISEDAWIIKLVFRIDVDVKKSLFSEVELKQINFQDIEKILDTNVTFETTTERNFIMADQKDIVRDTLLNDYLTSAKNYLSHPEFAKKLIIRAYNEKTNDRKCY